MKTCVVAFDLATTFGCAWHRNPMPRPFWEAARLPGEPLEVGRPAAALEKYLRDQFITLAPEGPPTHYFFEAQHLATQAPKNGKKQGNINLDTVYRLIALGAIVEKFAFEVGALCYKVDISTWRKHFIGRGSGFKRDPRTKKYLPGEDPKELAMQRCGEYGWHIDQPDAAEACGILDYGLTLLKDFHPRPWRDATLMRSKQR